MAWQLVFTGLDFVPLGEVTNAYDLQVSLGLCRISALSFRVRLEHPMADLMTTLEGYIKAYRDGELMFAGPLISTEEAGDATGASVTVNCADAGWFITKRLTATLSTLVGVTFSTDTDRAEIVRQLLITENTRGETHIDHTASVSSGSSITYHVEPYRPFMEILSELANTMSGFDWRFTPVENWANGLVASQKIAQFQARPTWGIQQPNAIFEWGVNGRGNITSYSRQATREQQANFLAHMSSAGSGDPSTPVLVGADTPSIDKWGTIMDTIQSDVSDSTDRFALMNDQIAVRKEPRKVINFVPNIQDSARPGRVPRFGSDYDLGDQVRARAEFNGNIRFDVFLRVWAVTFNLDNNGVERIALTLADDT